MDGQARNQDAAGNTTSIGSKTFAYNDANRMSVVKQGAAVVESYGYNHRGERVLRAPASGDAQVTVYDEAGRWVGNYSATGQAQQQAIWLDNYPVALIRAPATGVPGLAYIQPDHLGTPRVVIDPLRDVAIWEWSNKSEVFGDQAPANDPDGDGVLFELALRFPGQQATNASGLFYNYQREYEPAVGRYSQSDPIGLDGGISTFSYVRGGPLGAVDPSGLKDCECLSATFSQIRSQLPSKGVVGQVADGVSSYITGVAWGGTALAAQAGLLGQNPLQQAIDTNAQMGVVWDQVRAHPQQSAIAVGAVASKYPVQTASRIASGGAVSMIYSYPVGLSVSALAAYGSGFKAAHQNPQAVAAAAVVGEEVCK